MLICYTNFILFCCSLCFYLFIDFLVTNRIEGKYYFLHFINNALVVYYSYSDVINVYSNLYLAIDIEPSYTPLILTISLHIYHIIAYFSKLRFDDWLHHILMIFVLIPLSIYVKAGILINHALFFLSGLPGGIDYLLLCLTRNKLINRMSQKNINCQLNLWMRAPGCIAHSILAILCLRYKCVSRYVGFSEFYLSIFGIFLVYWNGIYFMNQVVQNYAINKFKQKD
ncbi:hypothetical protein CPAV1605_1065 [seawater metagenome]|uniref:TLC domain-containing protein n=1 Tax=seawater metagenome TaxID=1561972 RepID=A0A5E8CKQ9_9ZZZZ